MFEAPGVYDAHDHPQLSERINRGRLHDFRFLVESRHRPEVLASMIASDQLFSVNPSAAYAEAWAFTFFFSGKRAAKICPISGPDRLQAAVLAVQRCPAHRRLYLGFRLQLANAGSPIPPLHERHKINFWPVY